MNKITISLASASLFFTVSLFANSRIEGNAVGLDGRPLKNAQVQIQLQNSKASPVTVKSDSKGRFVASVATAGKYNVAVMDRGAVVSSAAGVTVKNGQSVNANLRPAHRQVAAAANNRAPKKGKHWVWVPAQTGSSIGGHYEEVDDKAGSQGLDNTSSNTFQRMQTQARRNTQSSQ